MNEIDNTPFGLLFEEAAPDLVEEIAPIYDESNDMSFVKDSEDRLIPFVIAAGPQTTGTVTKAFPETTDQDFTKSLFKNTPTKTETVTFVMKEDTDSDRTII